MSLLAKVGKKALIVLGAAALVVLVSVIAAAADALWLAVAGIGGLQLAVLALLLRAGSATDSAQRLDALGNRVVAALENERLEAADRHQALLTAVRESPLR